MVKKLKFLHNFKVSNKDKGLLEHLESVFQAVGNIEAIEELWLSFFNSKIFDDDCFSKVVEGLEKQQNWHDLTIYTGKY